MHISSKTRDRQACELNEVRRAQLEKEAEEQRREAEKKKPRLNSFDPNRRIGNWIVPQPASYALDKIDNLDPDFGPRLTPESLKAFFVALERHPGRSQTNVKEALVVYQSRVRCKWFDALARNESLNIGLIDDDLVRTILGEVHDRIWERKFDQVRTHVAQIPGSR
ncbi:hypothetical protein EDB86DRAFT_3070280 [Lactarius hatsudake]|nr:hypothetical protein EDB86DRAFT_3070280 [Lactarius hatsudake]